jgi:hypothetical protein
LQAWIFGLEQRTARVIVDFVMIWLIATILSQEPFEKYFFLRTLRFFLEENRYFRRNVFNCSENYTILFWISMRHIYLNLF